MQEREKNQPRTCNHLTQWNLCIQDTIDYQGVQVSLHVNGHPDYGGVAIFKCPD